MHSPPLPASADKTTSQKAMVWLPIGQKVMVWPPMAIAKATNTRRARQLSAQLNEPRDLEKIETYIGLINTYGGRFQAPRNRLPRPLPGDLIAEGSVPEGD